MDRKSGIILAFIAFLLLYPALSEKETAGLPRPVRKGSAIEDLRIFQVEGGVEHWELRARRADLLEKARRAELEGVELLVRDSPGLSVRGRRGRYDFEAGTLLLRGDVRIRGENWVLRTEEALWDRAAGRLSSESAVRMEGRTFDLAGTGLEIDTRTQVARTREVTCTFRRD